MHSNHDPSLRERLAAEWRALAPAWIEEMQNGSNAPRAGQLDPVVLELCGEVGRLSVFDSGCGEGRLGRMLAGRGAAKVLGMDLCDDMIESARRAAGPVESYRAGSVESMPELASASFDLAVSYLNQCDLPDWMANTREIHRILRPGGVFVVANLHPMRSATGGWHRHPDGSKAHVILDRYFDESTRHWKMMGVAFTNFHRSLETYLTGYLSAGFVLETLREPSVTPENLARYPQLDDELRVPNFIVFKLRKPPV